MSDDDKPTPMSVQSVLPPTVEQRVKAIEEYISTLKIDRAEQLAEIHTEIASIKQAILDERTKREDLAARVTNLVEKVDSLSAEMSVQTTMLKSIGADVARIASSVAGVFANPKVRQLAYSALGSIVFILSIISMWLATRAERAHAPATPPTVVTVVVPAAPPPTPAPKDSAK